MAEFFVTRKGTIDHGKQFESLHVANFVLNLVQDNNIKNFHLSANDENYGAFDDIVVDVDTGKGRQVYALQLKHQQHGSLKINDMLRPNGNYSIQKYFNSFKNTENKAQKFILYTNVKCNIEINELFELRENLMIKLIKVSLNDTFKISDRTDSCYQFKIVGESSTEDFEEYKNFFNCFWLYTNQENVHQLQKRVINTFKTEFAANEIESDLYLKFVTNWCNKDGRKEKLNKEWMQLVIVLIILSSRVKPLSFEPINDKVKIFQKTIDEFDITVFENNFCEKVVKLWGDANTKPYDTKELNQLCKKFQLLDTSINDINTVNKNVASKLMWLMGACPLIVAGDETVYKAIELCPNKKFILLEKNSIKYPQSTYSAFRHMSDLDKNNNNFLELIKACTCSIQEKSKLSLKNLIKKNRKPLEAIGTDDLLEMIEGVRNVGGEKKSLPIPYIERYLVRNVIDLTYLDSLKQDTIVIVDCVVKMKILKNTQNKLVCIDNSNLKTAVETESNYERVKYFNSTIYYSKEICSYTSFISIREMHESIKIHHFRFTQDDRLEWIRSKGDVNDLQKYKTDLLIEETKLFSSQHKECINLIVADPGMGKSELMKSLKNNCPSDLWTVIISPKDVLSFCINISNQKNNVKSFDEFLFNRINDSDKVFFQNCVEQNKVLYIWDALDEITDNQLKIVVEIILELSLMKRVQWITSRYYLKNFLESELSTIAFNLTHFDVVTQKLYIEKRLQINDTKKKDEIFAKIPTSFILVEHISILGIPLQLFMLTELFLQNKQKYLDRLNEQFILTDLYFHFVEEKIKIYLEQKVGVQYGTRGAESLQYDAVNNLEKLALILLFSTEILQSLNVTVEIDEQKRQDCLSIGIVTDFTNHTPHFIHNSFAEYFVAVFFSKNYNKFKNVLKDVLFESRFLNVRLFFDMLLAQNCPSHIAVLYKNIDLLKSYENEIRTSKDDGGRNALHLACAWGQIHPTLKVDMVDGCYMIDDDLTSYDTRETGINKALVEYLLNICDMCDTDTLFNMEPLSYAQKSGNFLNEIKIMTKQGINIFTLDTQHAANILYYSTLFGYDEVIDIFKTNNQESEARKILYVNMKNNEHYTLLFIACGRGYEEIVKFLVANGSQVNLASVDGATPLYIASLQGGEKITEFLVANGSQVNLADENGIAPLHVASLQGYERIVELLLTNGSQVNLAIEDGFTPLHVASLQGNEKIVGLLVANGSQVNLADTNGDTPLLIASRNGHKAVIELLVAHGSQVNLANKDAITPLHVASEQGYEGIVEFLVAKGAQVNQANKNGATPLYIASQNGHEAVIKFLVTHGAKVNLATKNAVTPLHVACQEGYEKVVEFLVTNGSQVNLPDIDGYTPLYVASQNGRKAVVEVLVANGSQVNLRDKNGNTPLHIASQNGHKAVIEFLVAHGSKVNLANKDAVTPLYVASQQGYKRIVEVLVAKGSQVNRADENRTTPLYIASRNSHEAVIKFLMGKGSKVNLADTNGNTPLHIASQHHRLAVVKLLVAHGSQVNLPNKDAVTPLFIAAQQGYKRIVEFLVAKGSQVNCANKDRATPLYIASRNGHEAVVKFLVVKGSQVNLADKNGITPLHAACHYGHRAVIEILVAHGSQVNFANKNGYTPLHVASLQGYERIVKFLVMKGSQVNLADKKGNTPLHIASQGGHDIIIEFLVAHGSQVNFANKDAVTPLHVACHHGHKAVIELLVAHGSHVNLANKDGVTPLHVASLQGYERIVEFLVTKGCQVSLVDKFGDTPLHMASRSGHKAVVEVLLAHGSEVNLANEGGVTPLHIASLQGNKTIVELLVANGAQLNLAEKDGFTPLYIASEKGHAKIVKFLVANGSQVNLADKEGVTPLYIASQNGNERIVKLLVTKETQVNLANKNGNTPLHVASQEGHDIIVEFLVAKGSKVNLANEDGVTPLHLALNEGHRKIVKFLVEKGSQLN